MREQELLTVKETAARLGVHQNTVRNWVRTGTLRSARVAGTREHRFDVAEVERVAASRGKFAEAAALIGKPSSPILATAEDLESWAKQPVAASEFPRVVRYMLASFGGVSRVRMPSGAGVSKHGWDGTAFSDGTGLLPAGELFIEVSVNADPATKAKADFEKRAAAVKGAGAGAGIFLFVTARRWHGADAWARKMKAAGPFAHVVVLDPDDLAAALDRDHAVHHWVSEQIGLNPSGAESLATWWERFRAQTEPPLPAGLFLAGRESATESLRRVLSAAEPADRRTVVRAAWVDEVLAFVYAVLVGADTAVSSTAGAADGTAPEGKSSDADDEGSSVSAGLDGSAATARALVVSDATAWARAASAPVPSVLVTTARDGSAFDLGLALRNGHAVIEVGDASTFPGRGPDATTLPRLAVEPASDALIASRFNSAEAAELAHLARRSLHALIRNKARSPLREHSPWARDADASGALGALALCGSWTVQPADIAVVEAVTGRPWEANERLVRHWAGTQDPPFVTSGKSWFATAHEDALLQLLPSVTSGAIERFREALAEIFIKSPAPKAPTLESMVKGDDQPPQVSSDLRAGLMQTLILLGVHPELLGRPDEHAAALSVRELMAAAFDDPSGGRLEVIAPFFPNLAEAAPEVFMHAVEDALTDHRDLIGMLFADGDEAGDSGLFPQRSLHTHLLWALETLAWSPEFFDQAVGALAQVAEIDPGGRLGNRPDRSLREILMPWASHTSASAAERASALRMMSRRSPGVAWKVLMGIWPSNHATSMVPRLPEFRDWSGSRTVAIGEVVRRLEVLAEIAPELAGTDASKWAQLVDRIHFMPRNLADVLRTQLGVTAEALTDTADQRLLRRTLGEVTERHEQYSYTDWAMSKQAREHLTRIAATLVGDEPELEYAGLFDWEVERRAGRARRKLAASGGTTDDEAAVELMTTEQLWEDRKSAALDIAGYEQDQLTRLAQQVKVPNLLGRALGTVPGAPNVRPVLAWLGETGPLLEVATGWVGSWSSTATADDIRELLAERDLVGDENPARLRFLTSCTSTRALAEVLAECTDDYDLFWRNVHPYSLVSGEPLEPVAHLVRVQRPWAAMEVLSMELHGQIAEDRALELAAMARSILDAFFDPSNPPADTPHSSPSYEISQLLDHISRYDPDAPLAQYEFWFHRILNFDRRPTALFKLLANDPEEYIALFNTAFAAPAESENTSETTTARHNAWSVLDDFNQIPGAGDDGTIDEEALRNWVRSVRASQAGTDLEALGDEMIGRILASTLGRGKHTMPPPEVCNVFGEYGNNRMATGFVIARINSVGVTTRGAHDGGDQERKLAEKYVGLSTQCRADWPRMSRALRSIADDLERSAQRMDEEAERRGFGV